MVAAAVFVLANILVMLLSAVVMMENKRGWNAIKRSKELVRRSLATATAAFLIMFLIPAVSAGIISFMVNMTAKALGQESSKVHEIAQQIKGELNEDSPPANTAAPAAPADPAAPAPEQPAAEPKEKKEGGLTIGIGNNAPIKIGGEEKEPEGCVSIRTLPLVSSFNSFSPSESDDDAVT